MTTPASPWFSVSRPGSTIMRCAACAAEIDLGGPHVDHHPRVCPQCGIPCAYLNWKDHMIQVLPEASPGRFGEALAWLQANFDELDYVELLCAFEEIAEALATPGATAVER
jgi:hypothetical protein